MTDFPENNIEKDLEAEELSTVFSAPTEHKKKAEATLRKRPWRVILSSFLAVAILITGTVTVIKLIPEKEEEEIGSSLESITVLEKNKDDFSEVTVKNKNGSYKFYSETATTEATEDTEATTTVSWYLEGVEKELLNTTRISNTISSIAAISASREITQKSAESCGLTIPYVEVTIKEGEEEYSIAFGDDSPDNSGCYLKLSSSDKIYLVDTSLKNDLVFDELYFANDDSISPIPTDDTMSDYISEDGTIAKFDKLVINSALFSQPLVIEYNQDEVYAEIVPYIITSPTRRYAENLDEVVSAFSSGISVSGVYSIDASNESLKKLGLDKPDFEATMYLAGKTYTFKLKLQSDGNYAAFADGERLIKQVSPSNVPYTQYEAKNFYRKMIHAVSLDDLSAFSLSTPDKTYGFTFKKIDGDENDADLEVFYNDQKIDVSDFRDFYIEVIGLSNSDYTVENISGNSEYTFTFTYNKDSSVSKTEFIKASDTRYQYSINGVSMGKVSSTDLKKIVRALEKLVGE